MKGVKPGAAAAALLAQVGLRIGGDHHLGEWCRLDQEEPVPIGAGKGVAGVAVHFARRRDIEHAEPFYAIGVIKCQPVGHAAAAIVAGNAELLMTEGGHDVRPCPAP